MVAHPKDPVLFTASADKTVRSWDMEKLSGLKKFEGLTDFVYAVAVSPDGTRSRPGRTTARCGCGRATTRRW